MNLYSEALLLLNGTIWGVTFVSPPPHLGEQGGEEKQVTPTIVPFSVSVTAVVTNKVETTIQFGSTNHPLLWGVARRVGNDM